MDRKNTLSTFGYNNVIKTKAKGNGFNKNLSLDALRAVAAFLVVLGHLKTLFFQDFTSDSDHHPMVWLFYLMASLGNAAVIVFFVLSGFFVGGSVVRSFEKHTFSWKNFLVARASRLWIVLIPVIILTVSLDRSGNHIYPDSDIYDGSPAYHSVIPAEGALEHLGLLDIIGNLLFTQGILVSTLGTNSPLWSLAFEFWYYILFPSLLLIVLPSVSLRRKSVAILILLCGVFFGGIELWSLFPAWLLGAAIAYFQNSIQDSVRKLTSTSLSWLQVLATGIVAISLVVSKALGGSYLTAVFVVTIPTMFFLMLHIDDVRNGMVRKALVPLAWIGAWSYTLYAIHMPILAIVAAAIVPSASTRFDLNLHTFVYVLLLLCAVMLIAWLLSLVTERHSVALRNRILKVVVRDSSKSAIPPV